MPIKRLRPLLLLLIFLASSAQAAIVLVVNSGNAQLVPANLGMDSNPIVINVQNGGVNVVGATVTLTCLVGGSSTTPPFGAVPITDSSGNTSFKFVPGTQSNLQYIIEYDCTATYSGSTTTFIEIGFYVSPSLILGVNAVRATPPANALNPYTIAGGAGVPGAQIKFQVYRTDTLAGVPNVGCRLIPIPDGTAGTQQIITSSEGTGPENLVLTDAGGNCAMTPTFTYANSAMSAVTQTFKWDFGKFNYFGPFTYQIGAAVTITPTPVSIVGGNSSAASQRGNLDYDDIAVDARQGAGTKILTTDGTGASGNLPMYTSTRSVTDSGISIASISGGLAAHVITLGIDGGGSAITTGTQKTYPQVNFTCTINSVKVSADQVGSITVDVWKANAAIPTAANKISATAPATLSSAQLNQNSSLTGWTLAVAPNDVFGFSVASAATITNATVSIFCQ